MLPPCHGHSRKRTNESSRGLVPLRRFVVYFVKLGTLGFGGPIALAGHMQRDLVEERRWVTRQDYREGLALAQLAPGPLAAQLAIYLGWVRAGVLGGTLVAIAFVLPSFVTVLAIAALYVRFGGLSWIQGAFYGIGAAVIAIIARSAWKLTRMTLGKDWLLWSLFGISALTTAWTETEIVWLFVLCGVIRSAQNPMIKAFVDGVTAAATGAIAGAVFVLGKRALVDLTTTAIALMALGALFKLRKLPEPLVILVAGIVGVLLFKGVR